MIKFASQFFKRTSFAWFIKMACSMFLIFLVHLFVLMQPPLSNYTLLMPFDTDKLSWFFLLPVWNILSLERSSVCSCTDQGAFQTLSDAIWVVGAVDVLRCLPDQDSGLCCGVSSLHPGKHYPLQFQVLTAYCLHLPPAVDAWLKLESGHEVLVLVGGVHHAVHVVEARPVAVVVHGLGGQLLGVELHQDMEGKAAGLQQKPLS